MGAVTCSLLGKREEANGYIQQLRSLYLEHKMSFPSMSSELLYGQVGYLYSLLYVNGHVPGVVEESVMLQCLLTALCLFYYAIEKNMWSLFREV